MARWAVAATAAMVARTRPTASRLIGCRFSRRVQQRWQEDQQDQLGVKLHRRQARQQANHQAAHYQQDRIGHLDPPGQGGDDHQYHEQAEDDP
jgi:hypothetical protein